jgi:glycosyltransferase involved in cell wall biosynthesis
MPSPHIAVILPCYNEADAIRGVVEAFRRALPDAAIYVFDNASTDATAAEAIAAGAIVRPVYQRGKGNVVRQAFARVEADVYVIADGDGTYDAARAPEMVRALIEGDLDMVVCTREHDAADAYRRGHVAGNRVFNTIVRVLFGRVFVDIFSGYRVFSRPFVKSFPALATGFETETEMSLHAIQLGLPCAEIPTRYAPRMEGSASKLKTYRDGLRILWFIIRLVKHTRPLAMFATLGAIAALLAAVIGLPVVLTYLETGLVPRLPTAVAAASLVIIGAVSMATGVILDGVSYAQKESKRLAYIAVGHRTGPSVEEGAVIAPDGQASLDC